MGDMIVGLVFVLFAMFLLLVPILYHWAGL